MCNFVRVSHEFDWLKSTVCRHSSHPQMIGICENSYAPTTTPVYTPLASGISIHLMTGENIQMFSVHVFDTDGNDVTLAEASQSSTLKNFDASLAVDGRENTFR